MPNDTAILPSLPEPEAPAPTAAPSPRRSQTMDAEQTVEKVARAMYEWPDGFCAWDDCRADAQSGWIDLARAALLALCEAHGVDALDLKVCATELDECGEDITGRVAPVLLTLAQIMEAGDA